MTLIKRVQSLCTFDQRQQATTSPDNASRSNTSAVSGTDTEKCKMDCVALEESTVTRRPNVSGFNE
jgi:hypothetical protein